MPVANCCCVPSFGMMTQGPEMRNGYPERDDVGEFGTHIFTNRRNANVVTTAITRNGHLHRLKEQLRLDHAVEMHCTRSRK